MHACTCVIAGGSDQSQNTGQLYADQCFDNMARVTPQWPPNDPPMGGHDFVQFISSLFFMMFLGIGIIRTEKCWPNSPTYSTDVGVLRGWGRAQIAVDILGREAKKVEKHCTRRLFQLWY